MYSNSIIMKLLWCSVLVLSFKLSSTFAKSAASSFSEEFASLPKIFHLNETEKCPDGYYFCRFQVQLRPKDPENIPEIWKLIEKQSIYRRDIIYRAICSQSKALEHKLQDELLSYNLKGEVIYSHCNHKIQLYGNLGYYEFLIGLMLVSYLGFMIYCTLATYHSWESVNNKYVKMFSLITIWKEMQNPNRNEDFNKLLCLQSLRTIGMLGVVGAHTMVSLILWTFIRNPEYLEDAYGNMFFQFVIGSFGVLVQVFFVISSWLLAVQLHNTVRDKGELTLKDLSLLWLNRYIRLIPPALLILMICTSEVLFAIIIHPFFYSMVKTEVEYCRSNWWKNLLFFQNMESENQRMCQPGMWYIAAELQMYLIISGLFYLSRKFNISLKYLLTLFATLALSIQLYNAFKSAEYRSVIRLTPRLLPPEESFNIPKVNVTYFQTYGSCVTYVVGFTIGTMYFYNNGKTVFNTTIKKLFFYFSFLFVPIFCSYLSGREFNDFINILILISIRPMFGLGLAIGILGMATGSGGIMKKFLESKPMVYFGSFTYSIYIFHFFYIYLRTFYHPKYLELTNYHIVMTYIFDVIMSFALGYFMHVILEHPFMKLQKQMIPQMSRNRKVECKRE